MQFLEIFGAAALFLLPIYGIEYYFYRRWRNEYGIRSFTRYYLRSILGKKSVDDSPIVWLARFLFFVVWFIAWSEIVS